MTPAELFRAPWRKSTYSSQDGNCVEVASTWHARTVLIRDTQNRDSCTLQVSANEWSRFTRRISSAACDGLL